MITKIIHLTVIIIKLIIKLINKLIIINNSTLFTILACLTRRVFKMKLL